MRSLFIASAPQFDFLRTVHSHGWRMLPPFDWDEAKATLRYVYQSDAGEALRLQIRSAKNGIRVDLPDCPAELPSQRAEIEAAVGRMLNLDWDLRPFYQFMRAQPEYAWLERGRHGRILISPSLWEDLAKTLLTTNCSWAYTVQMSGRLCQLGAAHPSVAGCHAFPTPRRIAAMPGDDFAVQVRAGYRGAWLHELARKIDSGEIDLEAWRRLDGDGLFAAVKSLKGFGDYAAGTIARMYGHFDRLAIDSACHAIFAARHNGGVKAEAKAIEAHYARFGKWQGLVMWMDVMRGYED